jgi:hypothetical protein
MKSNRRIVLQITVFNFSANIEITNLIYEAGKPGRTRVLIRMKSFLLILGILLFVSFETRALYTLTMRAGSLGLGGLESHRSYNRTKNAEVETTMKQTRFVPTSVWGGSGIRVSVEQKKITFEYACANGEIVGRLKIDEHGSFKANGFHIRQRPGPIRVDDTPQRQPVRFEGKISGKTMTLSVILTETKENIGTFELKRDVTLRLMRCL